MNGRFLVLFAVTITLIVLALAAGRSVASGAGGPAVAALVAAVLPAALGLAALVRATYLDGAASRRAREGRPPR